MAEIQSIRGFKDILPEETELRHELELRAREVFRNFGFREINPPIVERTELFSKSIGEETDIVSKEMYSFRDLKGRSLSLRPEATASVIRAYVQNRLYDKAPIHKLFTIGPMFRYERPQKGRFRQFYQINAELIGDSGPLSDAELIILAMEIIKRFEIEDVELELNSLGCLECRRPFREELKDYLKQKINVLCGNCQRRLQINPLRVFDCKVKACKESLVDAPSILDFICDECKLHFDYVQEYLRISSIPFRINPKLVRGLDYYTKTTFEVISYSLGAQNAIAGGGRYDGLVKLLNGPDTPAMGFAIGVERVLEVLKAKGISPDEARFIYLIPLGEEARKRLFILLYSIRTLGIRTEISYEQKGLKSQLKRANRLGASHVLIVGDQELEKGKAILRDMETGTQKEMPLDDLTKALKKEVLS